MPSLRHRFFGCLIALAATAARGAVAISDLNVTNVGTSTFTVVWTTSEVSTPGLEVYSDAAGTNAVGASLGLEYYPIAEAEPTLASTSGERASRRALELLAINRRVVSVRVSGAAPGTAYFIRPRTFGAGGADNGTGLLPLQLVTTAQFTSMVGDGRLLRIRFLAGGIEGTVAVVQGPAGTAGLSGIVGDSTAPSSVVLPLANLLDTTTGTNALLAAPKDIMVRVLGAGAPVDNFAHTVEFTTTFGPARLEPFDAGVAPPTNHTGDTNQDFKLSLTELLRVIELFNTRHGTVRTGAYKVDAANLEDGLAPEPARDSTDIVTLAKYHSGDSNQDGKLSLTELLRVIELFNYREGTVRTGQYHIQVGTEDGYAPGP